MGIVAIGIVVILLIFLRNQVLPTILNRIPVEQKSTIDFLIDLVFIALALGLSIYGISLLEDSAQLIAIIVTIVTGAFIFTSEGWFQDMLGGISLKLTVLFKIDDIVTVAGNRGRVIHVGLFRVILETPTLDVISVRNSLVMQETIVNHSGIRFRQISVIVHTAGYGSYEDDIYAYLADVEQVAQRVQAETCPEAIDTGALQANAFFKEFGGSSDHIEVVYYTYDRDSALRPAISAMHMAMADELRAKGVVLGQVNANTHGFDEVLQHQLIQ